jgi:hypothetical protein
MTTPAFFLALALLALIAPAWAAEGEEEHPFVTFCAAEWEDDFQMQRHCVERQQEGWTAVRSFIERYGLTNEEEITARVEEGHPAAAIADGCFQEWLPDYRMVAWCMKRQEKAATELGKLPH